jgi:TRAP-type transport system periplasmic protein
MQTGSLDAAVTSSTSLISFRLEEVSKAVTSGKNRSFWFMLEPLIVSKSIFDGLSKEQQAALVEVGESLEKFGLDSAKADDERLGQAYITAGAMVAVMDAADIDKWRSIAQATAWKDFAGRNADCAKLLKLAEAVTS